MRALIVALVLLAPLEALAQRLTQGGQRELYLSGNQTSPVLDALGCRSVTFTFHHDVATYDVGDTTGFTSSIDIEHEVGDTWVAVRADQDGDGAVNFCALCGDYAIGRARMVLPGDRYRVRVNERPATRSKVVAKCE